MLRGHAARGAAFAVGLAAVLSVYVAATRNSQDQPKNEVVSAGLLDVSGAPLAAGTSVALSSAVASVPFPVPRPQADLASDTSITDVWVRTSWDPEVLIRYSSGVRVEVRRWPFTSRPEDYYQAQIAEGVPGQIVPIRGVNVFVVPRTSEASLGSATMVVEGLLVSIVGDGEFSVEQLQALAGSALTSAAVA
jgi:hypothetical protein